MVAAFLLCALFATSGNRLAISLTKLCGTSTSTSTVRAGTYGIDVISHASELPAVVVTVVGRRVASLTIPVQTLTGCFGCGLASSLLHPLGVE